ncbi:MAG: translation elongation factor Ts [Planctomycetes bacterium]|nr:translation elongation factor Ts [Planctomycetota bacterium]
MSTMEITSKMVADLRERTGQGMMECKKALAATGGDMEKSVDLLRLQGMKSAEKKADREMGEGRVAVHVDSTARKGALVAMTCQTDFLAGNDEFQSLLGGLPALAVQSGLSNAEALNAAKLPSGNSVEDSAKMLSGKTGENIKVARLARYENAQGFVGFYVHHDQKKGALVSVTTSGPQDKAVATLRELSMHIVMHNPAAVTRAEVPAEDVEREKAIYLEEVKGKPAEMQEKIVAGKLEKFYAARVLPEQPWIKDDSKTVQKVLEDALGKGTKIVAFTRVQIGK